MNDDISMTVQQLRALQRERPLTHDELKAALKVLRGGRVAAQATSTKSRTAKAKSKMAVDSDALLDELGGS